MHKYLICLQDYVIENQVSSSLMNSAEYLQRVHEQERAWTRMEEALTPEQMALVEAYQTAKSRVTALEDDLTFEMAVALGKWMILG